MLNYLFYFIYSTEKIVKISAQGERIKSIDIRHVRILLKKT